MFQGTINHILYEDDNTLYRGLVEPISGERIWIYRTRMLGGDERAALFIVECHPERTLLNVTNMSNMVFMLEGSLDNTIRLVKAQEGSRLIPTLDYSTYSGLALVPVDQLEFVELKETVNSERIANALEKATQEAKEARKALKRYSAIDGEERA